MPPTRSNSSIPSPEFLRASSGWFFSPVLLEGKWSVIRDEGFSARGAVYSTDPKSSVTLRFVGTEISWIGLQGPDQGKANVYIDGELRETVDAYSENRQVMAELFSARGLINGLHTIRVQVEGAENNKISDKGIVVDAFDFIR